MSAASILSACVADTFATLPIVFGAEFLSIDVAPVLGMTEFATEKFRMVHPDLNVENVDFCNVTVSYTHPGTEDRVIVEAWLPAKENWNERYYGAAGGGFAAGRIFLTHTAMVGAIGEGYVTSTTDGGLGDSGGDSSKYILRSPGNVDQYALRNFASVSLNEQAIISKSLANTFYGKPPVYSYWNGCSQGGRQGLMLAQRYPEAYDGISAAAPAIELPTLLATIFWPQQQMNMLGEYPYMCEMDAIAAATIAACDGLDGVVDGVISDVEGCLASFDPTELVGTLTHCSQTDSEVKISSAAARVVKGLWKGVVCAKGEQISNPLTPGTDFTGAAMGFPGIAVTDCSRSDGLASQPNVPGQEWVPPLDAKDSSLETSRCEGVPNILGEQFLRLWVGKDPSLDLSKLTLEKFIEMVLDGAREYGPLFDTNDADLSRFRDAGGKMITFHGVADSYIPIGNSLNYYKRVISLLPDTHDFYRYFEVPGMDHCFGGNGGQPTAIFEQLRAWVENGTVPESSPISFNDSKGMNWKRILCPFPQRSQYSKECGDATAAKCWSCTEN
ncbi:Tannase/feruloyl esterase [Ilyonectria destructans]|nr:Tannase/feruloyl esterase [Ilyonectria destructans]